MTFKLSSLSENSRLASAPPLEEEMSAHDDFVEGPVVDDAFFMGTPSDYNSRAQSWIKFTVSGDHPASFDPWNDTRPLTNTLTLDELTRTDFTPPDPEWELPSASEPDSLSGIVVDDALPHAWTVVRPYIAESTVDDATSAAMAGLERKIDQLIAEGRALRAEFDSNRRSMRAEFDRLAEKLDLLLRYVTTSTENPGVPAAASDTDFADLGSPDKTPLRSCDVDAMLTPFTIPTETMDRRLEDDPDMLDATAFAGIVGVTPQAVHQKRSRGEVIGLTRAKRKVWFPRAQIDEHGRLLPALSELLDACEGDEWETYRFLIQPQPGLGGATPRRALLDGRKGEVLTLLHGIREGGFG